MRIGIFGGTFDPPHNGHLTLARTCAKALELDEVLFVPAARNPFKERGANASGTDRLEMVRRLIEGETKMAISDMELSRGGTSYTVDTLNDLSMVQPAEYWLLMGADALKGFPEWRQAEKILRLARLAVVVRPPATEADLALRINPAYRERIDLVPMAPQAVSATEIRNRVARGQTIVPYVPAAVSAYIEEKGLYKS